MAGADQPNSNIPARGVEPRLSLFPTLLSLRLMKARDPVAIGLGWVVG